MPDDSRLPPASGRGTDAHQVIGSGLFARRPKSALARLARSGGPEPEAPMTGDPAEDFAFAVEYDGMSYAQIRAVELGRRRADLTEVRARRDSLRPLLSESSYGRVFGTDEEFEEDWAMLERDEAALGMNGL